MDLSRLLSFLACVECGSESMRLESETIACGDCGARWSTYNGIYDLRPESSVPLPKMYDDPDFREWNSRLAQIQEYFYESLGPVRWVQNSGHRVIQRWCRSKPDRLTLDLACGHGAHRPFLDSAENLVGLDIDQNSLQRLRRMQSDFFAVRGDCYRLPFRSGVFDRIINIYNLEHLVHLDFALEEAARVLKPDGEFLVSAPAEGGWAWRAGRRVSSARNFTDDKLDYRRANQIDHCNCIWQIEKAVRGHFRIERTHRFPFPVPCYHFNLVVTWRLRK